MNLLSLKLHQFRSHKEFVLSFSRPVCLIIGDNASGKTNILESIWLLSTGNSFRAEKLEEMVNWDQEVSHVIGMTQDYELTVTITKGVVQGRRVQKRLFKINGVGRRKLDFLGHFHAVIFRPEDMDLLVGDPRHRRQFLDYLISSFDPEYARALDAYDKALKRRNKILDLIQAGDTTKSALAFWDQTLIKNGNYLTDRRNQIVGEINTIPSRGGLSLRLVLKSSPISQVRLEEHYAAEVALGYTLVGPHKDDFELVDRHQHRNLAAFGSRGEQRMAVIWLKEANVALLEAKLGIAPVLLLDDILSELDDRHVGDIIDLTTRCQTVITSTNASFAELFPSSPQIIEL